MNATRVAEPSISIIVPNCVGRHLLAFKIRPSYCRSARQHLSSVLNMQAVVARLSTTIERMTGVSISDAAVGRSGIAVFLLFASADFLFIALHMAFEFHLTKDPVFSLEGDRIAGEFWQYVKEYWIAMVMGMLVWRRRQPVYAAWCAVFAYLLADDALQIHESSGAKIGQVLRTTALESVRRDDLGQIIFATACAVFLLCVMAIFYQKADRDARRVTVTLIAGLVLMGVFGVAWDAIHAFTALDALTVVEEGGELLVMSGICTLMVCEAWRELWDNSTRRSMSHHASTTR